MEPLPNFSGRLILTISRRLKAMVPFLARSMTCMKEIFFYMYMGSARYGTAMDHISGIGILRLSQRSDSGSISIFDLENLIKRMALLI